MLRQRILPLAAVAAVTLALSACGGGDGDAGGGYSSSPAPLSAPAQPPADSGDSSGSGGAGSPGGDAAPAVDGAVLEARLLPELGKVVVDGEGFTLYRFDNDKAKPPTATCVDDCATEWPPVVVDPEGKLTLQGVEQSAVGMVQRTDGTSQLTVSGWPVYRFAGDAGAGTATGQGVDGTWFAVTPNGTKAAATG
jgi:predicted lipoprotein with Yx(FWY)xxD motif